MKMKVLRTFSLILMGTMVLISACQKEDENKLSAQDTIDITEEAVAESLFQDLDDMARAAIGAPSDSEYKGGRVSTTITIEDHRFNCDGVVVTLEILDGSTVDHPKGIITVDFGTTGCQDLRNRTRKGKLIFNYDGRRFQPGAKIITTTDNYFVNDIKLEGTRTLTNITGSTEEAPKFKAVLTGGKAIFKDQSEATRESNITWTWVRAANPLQDELVISTSSTAEGTTRAGRSYTVSVTEPLHYRRLCSIAVSGIKQYTIDGDKVITVDYGDGTCDNTITVTVNGVTRTVTVQ